MKQKGREKKISKSIIMTMLITGTIFTGGSVVFASENDTQTFTLDQMIVTATRYEKEDVDVPASTVILTAKDLEESGADNLATALSKVSGLAYKQFGPGGSSMGTMINEVNIRGVSNGTLILVNGNPVSWRGRYNLDAFPIENIERVEIVKGGGSVLYGSEAMGGVINIITKKKANNNVTVGYGNFGQQKYNVNVGDEKFNVSYNSENWNSVKGVSNNDVTAGSTRTDANDIMKDNIAIGYNFNENLNLSYNYHETEVSYDKFWTDVKGTVAANVGDQLNGRKYSTKQHIAQINYKDENFKASTYFNKNNIGAFGPTYFTNAGSITSGNYDTNEMNQTYGLDLQKNWEINDKVKAIFGVTYQDEYYDTSTYKSGGDYERNNWAIYGQWEQVLNDKNTMLLSARETWTTGAPGNQNYSNFSAAGQLIHALGENSNIYASVGQSFIMPTFAQMYGSTDTALPNPGLQPQTGINYEMGWKKVADSHSWKAAIYHIEITDNISYTMSKDNTIYQYTNEDFRNTGLEVTCDIQGEDGWSYNWGVNYGDPQSKSTGVTSKKPYWDRKFGRLQLSGGIKYHKDKWLTSLTGSYLGERVGTPSTAHSEEIKPYFLTTLSTKYQVNKNSDITLTMDNILDRNDNLSHTGGSYYATPFNYLLSYTYKF